MFIVIISGDIYYHYWKQVNNNDKLYKINVLEVILLIQ